MDNIIKVAAFYLGYLAVFVGLIGVTGLLIWAATELTWKLYRDIDAIERLFQFMRKRKEFEAWLKMRKEKREAEIEH